LSRDKKCHLRVIWELWGNNETILIKAIKLSN